MCGEHGRSVSSRNKPINRVPNNVRPTLIGNGTDAYDEVDRMRIVRCYMNQCSERE
jgi:hypothetical protein